MLLILSYVAEGKKTGKMKNSIYDNPVMAFLGNFADLVILNVLTLFCCIPIVTIGASFTAMHYVVSRMRRHETIIITEDFFHAFKNNLKQATLLWVIFLLVIIINAAQYYLMYTTGSQMVSGVEFVVVKYIAYLLSLLVLIGLTWSFVLLSRYENSIGRTVMNAYCISFTHIFRTLLMVILMVAPIALLLVYPFSMPVVLAFGFSLTGYLEAMIYGGVFSQLECKQEVKESREI